MNINELPRVIDAGLWDAGHVQGIAVDTARGYIYYSFTTILVRSDLSGNIIGYVGGLTGHLGCIDINPEDGCVYGSIEYKHDSIGQGIMEKTGVKLSDEDAFYIAIFDVDRIDRLGMDAETDGIMRAVYLPEVVADFSARLQDGREHRYACSGIDGLGFGPRFGAPADSPRMLTVAYGIYGDNERTDNDYQVLLTFDWRKFSDVALPLNQGKPHHSGVLSESKSFLFTGNTTWGIQNLKYDPYTGDWFAAVYKGKKPSYPNYPLYRIDGKKAPERAVLQGIYPAEEGDIIFLSEEGLCRGDTGIKGYDFKYGQTGIAPLGGELEGYFYISHNRSVPVNGGKYKLQTSHVHLYRYTDDPSICFEEVK